MTREETIPARRRAASPSSASSGIRRLATAGFIGLLALYLVGTAAAYAWLHYARNAGQIGFLDVAFFRVRQVRHAMAEQQFAQARVALAKKDFRAAYIAFATALRRDPDNVEGRLEAAAFFGAAGSLKLELSVLEEGLARSPGDPVLADQTLKLLTSTGRDRAAIELIQRLYGDRPTDANASLVETYQILANLNLGNVDGAEQELASYPELRRSKFAIPALAFVLWRSREKVEAIELLSHYVATGPAALANYSQLAEWQAAGGMPDDAVATARRAVEKFPSEIAPRVLAVAMLAARSPGSPEFRSEGERFISDYADRPEALAALAELAGQKGWVDLARNIYLASADRQADVHILALYYADALTNSSRVAEARVVLDQVEAQSEGSGLSFTVQLRRREVLAAAASGDRDAVREHARFLAAAVQRNDPDNIEIYRRFFARLGVKDALGAFPTQ
jgi:tetratricopeptide (TPR) repeat protein